MSPALILDSAAFSIFYHCMKICCLLETALVLNGHLSGKLFHSMLIVERHHAPELLLGEFVLTLN